MTQHGDLVELHRRYWAAKEEMKACHKEMTEELARWLKAAPDCAMESHDVIELLNLQARYFADETRFHDELKEGL